MVIINAGGDDGDHADHDDGVIGDHVGVATETIIIAAIIVM